MSIKIIPSKTTVKHGEKQSIYSRPYTFAQLLTRLTCQVQFKHEHDLWSFTNCVSTDTISHCYCYECEYEAVLPFSPPFLSRSVTLSATKWREWVSGSDGGVPGPRKGQRACWWWGSNAGMTPPFLICCSGCEISRNPWLPDCLPTLVTGWINFKCVFFDWTAWAMGWIVIGRYMFG